MPGLLSRTLPHEPTFFDLFIELGEKVYAVR
jgi:hypothetical protein